MSAICQQPPPRPENSSVLGRLLEEISWEGTNVRGYRNGGRGRENVLTAEVLGPLSHLPRSTFLSAVLRAGHGADETRETAAAEAEQVEITLLPEQSQLAPGGIVVQPDGLLQTPSCHILLEAKGMGRSAFQPEQLAREFVCVIREAGAARSLLLLVIPSRPPVPVRSHGRLSLPNAIGLHLGSVVERTPGMHDTTDTLLSRIPECVAWITWHEVREAVANANFDATTLPAPVAATIQRLRDALIDAIDWHSGT